MRHGLLLLAPLLALAGCDRAGFERSDGSFDRAGYREQSIADCRARLQRDNSTSVAEADRNSLCICIVDTAFAASNDDQLREYYRNGGIPPERTRLAELQCQAARPGQSAPADEEPPPSDGGPPPVIPPPGRPALPGSEVADGPDAGAGASAPGGTRARVGSLARYITADDYPAAALRNNEQGRVAFILDIGPTGRVTACTVTELSGSATLDSATCRIMRSRPRYTPGRNAFGQNVADRDRAVVRWALPD